MKNLDKKLHQPKNQLTFLKAMTAVLQYACYIWIFVEYGWKLSLAIWIIMFSSGMKIYATIVMEVAKQIGKQFLKPLDIGRHDKN